MKVWPETISLRSEYCTLELLSHDHYDDLVVAVEDGELWNLWYAMVPRPDEMREEISRRLALREKGAMLPFAVIHNKTGRAIGMTTYCYTDGVNRRFDIGWTWYAKSQQRTPLNTECKHLLLTHAFEQLDCIAVGFRVDVLNRRSRAAVERLGARYEGTMRNYCIMPSGHPRDMRFYSILPHEWPAIKQNLQLLMQQTR